MKKFRTLFLIFLLPILVIGVSMELLLRNIPNRFHLQHNYIKAQGEQIKTLIIGSSHTQFGITPTYLDSPSFNLSNVSQTIDLDFDLIKHYQPFLPQLETVIIRLSYTTLYEKLSDSNESWRLKDYVIYQDLESSRIVHHFEILSVSLAQNIKRIRDYYGYKKNNLYSDSLGWGTEAESKNSKNLDLTGPIVAHKHTITEKQFLFENKKIYHDLAKWSAKNSVNLLVVTLPGYKTYYDNMDVNQIETMMEFGNSLENSYNNVRYLNFLKDSRFTQTDFYDADHLNDKGAKKFSLIINDKLTH